MLTFKNKKKLSSHSLQVLHKCCYRGLRVVYVSPASNTWARAVDLPCAMDDFVAVAL